MKVSLNTVREFTKVELSLDELVAKINAQLGGVEEVINLAKRYEDALVVKVVSAEQHPDADRLRVCKVDDGGVVANAPRDENGHVQVVCGAPNAVTGMWAVWLPPGSTVPASFDDKEPFVLSARELRGVLSQGMLAASDELGIGTDHEGIVELHENELKSPDTKLAPGMNFAKLIGLDDQVIDIENKMFTHRPDLFGQLGVAREIAGITGRQFESPEWYLKRPSFTKAEGLKLTVENEAEALVPRFMAVAVQGVKVRPSPLWLQCELVRMGGKPINNIVDATNYIMLLTAQPTHAYDYDKLRTRPDDDGAYLGVRMAREDETVSLLNDKTYTLTSDDIVIVDGQGPVGLAGVMGGNNSEVSEATANIVLEVANFDMYAVRKSSMRHGVFTDALTRFNKGQSPLQNDRVLARLLWLIQELAGGQQASAVFDEMNKNVQAMCETTDIAPPQSILPKFIRDRLGVDISKHDMVQMLGNVEFPLCEDCGWDPDDKVDNDEELHVNVPFWRTDIQVPEDVVEEIGRLYGFDKLPHVLPTRSLAPARKNQRVELKQRIREVLARLGGNELLTYSFVHEKTLRKAEQDSAQAFRLGNALSPDLQYYRLSVLPSLLDRVHPNIKAGHDEFVLFELGKGHNKKYHLNDDHGLPKELEFVDAVYASKKPHTGAPYYHIRSLLDELTISLGLKLVYKSIPEPLDFPVTAPFNQQRSALVETTEGVFIGMVGELRQSVRKNFKLPDYVSAMTLDFEGLFKATQDATQAYQPLSKYPSVTQDISLKIPNGVKLAEVISVSQDVLSQNQLGDVVWNVTPLGVYQAEDDSEHKTITLRIRMTSSDRTLKDVEVAGVLDAIAQKAQETCNAERS